MATTEVRCLLLMPQRQVGPRCKGSYRLNLTEPSLVVGGRRLCGVGRSMVGQDYRGPGTSVLALVQDDHKRGRLEAADISFLTVLGQGV